MRRNLKDSLTHGEPHGEVWGDEGGNHSDQGDRERVADQDKRRNGDRAYRANGTAGTGLLARWDGILVVWVVHHPSPPNFLRHCIGKENAQR